MIRGRITLPGKYDLRVVLISLVSGELPCHNRGAMQKTSKPATARKSSSTVATLDREIDMLVACLADATSNDEIDAINEGIEAAQSARRAHFRTGGTRSN